MYQAFFLVVVVVVVVNCFFISVFRLFWTYMALLIELGTLSKQQLHSTTKEMWHRWKFIHHACTDSMGAILGVALGEVWPQQDQDPFLWLRTWEGTTPSTYIQEHPSVRSDQIRSDQLPLWRQTRQGIHIAWAQLISHARAHHVRSEHRYRCPVRTEQNMLCVNLCACITNSALEFTSAFLLMSHYIQDIQECHGPYVQQRGGLISSLQLIYKRVMAICSAKGIDMFIAVDET